MHKFNVYTDRGDYLGEWGYDEADVVAKIQHRNYCPVRILAVERA